MTIRVPVLARHLAIVTVVVCLFSIAACKSSEPPPAHQSGPVTSPQIAPPLPDRSSHATTQGPNTPVPPRIAPPPIEVTPIAPVVIQQPPPPPKVKSPPPPTVSIADIGKSPRPTKRTSYDFQEDVIEGDLARPDASAPKETVPPPIERYPNIEAPDTVAMGQEIAVQVSLTSDQLAPETKILAGSQHDGKVQLQMAAGENQWTLTVNLTAPGMEFTRSGNTADITISRDGDSSLAVFYMRPTVSASAQSRRETRILATLLHNGAFIARLARPLTIVAAINQPAAQTSETALAASPQKPDAQPKAALARAAAPAASTGPSIQFDPDLFAPDLTIVENRVGNILRVNFFSPHSAPVEADIPDPDALHAWIQTHYAQMASHGRGFEIADGQTQSVPRQRASDYLNGFGAELYDRFAPQAFKDLFWKLMDNSTNHSPQNDQAKWAFESIQVLSDDPAIPWELMRPSRADGTGRMDFLGLHFMIARWPLAARGVARPPQLLALRQSAVIAPVYSGAEQLASTGAEMATLKSMKGFGQVGGSYAAVRGLAMHPPQGIVHFAGHGAVADKGGVPQFAILLEDSEMDPSTWRALLPAGTGAHPLFFFNACDVGESRRFLNDVDGWAPVLLESGASGYIGALWPVNDATAEAIAASFYRQISTRLRERSNVAMALAKARAEVFAQTADPTALAYVFYGDPHFAVTTAR